jgi:hypothetical protein
MIIHLFFLLNLYLIVNDDDDDDDDDDEVLLYLLEVFERNHLYHQYPLFVFYVDVMMYGNCHYCLERI